MAKTWMITGVSSGFGREMTEQLLSAGDRVIGTVRSTAKVADLIKKYPDTFDCVILDVTDAAKVTETVNEAAAKHGRIDVYVSNAGYGLFGAAEELSLEEIDRILNTNLRGSIAFIRAAIPHLRKQGGGRIIQISSYGGQVAYPGNSLYHATKFGIEGFCESVAQEVAPFGPLPVPPRTPPGTLPPAQRKSPQYHSTQPPAAAAENPPAPVPAVKKSAPSPAPN